MASTANDKRFDLWEGDVLTIAKRFNHDLRSPLGAISTSAEVLQMLLDGKDADVANLISGIESSAARGVELLNRVVLLLRATFGERPASVSLCMSPAVDHALVANEMMRREAKAVITSPRSWPVWDTVEDWVTQVWTLLISNAIKHGGKTISIGCDEVGDELRCWVRDDGPGLSQERARDPFPAFESLHEKAHVHGLGLPMVRRLTTLLQGSCHYKRTPQGQTEFAFVLPRSSQAKPQVTAAPAGNGVIACAKPMTPAFDLTSLMPEPMPVEREFDTLLSMVRRQLCAPLAMVTLVEKDGQVTTDSVGAECEMASSEECLALCQRVIAEDAPLTLNEIAPGTGGRMRAFLGVPVHDLDGHAAGALAVVDFVPHAWSDEDLAAMQDGALLARKDLRLRAKRAKLEAAIKWLRQDEALNHSLMESSTDCIKLLDMDGRLLDMNGPGRCIMEVEDFTPLKGLRWADVWPADMQPLVSEAVHQAQGGGSSRFQGRCPTLKGHWRWWDVVVTGVRDGTGRLSSILSISRDITASKQTELSAVSNAQSLRNILDSLSVFVGLLSVEGHVQEANVATLAITGATLESVMGMPFDETPWWQHSEIERARVREAIAQAAAGESVRHQVTVWTEGGIIDVDFTLVPMFDNEGHVTHLVFSGVDLTPLLSAQHALGESERFFRMLADHMSQLAWITEASGEIFWYNKRWFDYTGTTLEEMRGWGWQKVHHPDHVQRVVKKISRCFQSGEVWEDTFPLRGRDGSYRWFLSRAIPIHDGSGRIIHWFGTNTDITEQREGEEALRQASQAKDDFIAVLSHELRTPLNPVLLIASAASTRDDLPPDVRKDFHIIRKNVEMEARLIDDLLDMTRVLRGKLPLLVSTVLFDELLADVMSQLHTEAMPKGLQVETQFNALRVRLQGDEVRIRQIIWNIMRNAVKFTPPGGRVHVATSLTDTMLVITVTDSGIGMNEDELKRVFEPFAQGDHATNASPARYGGLGLGLAIARLLVEQHGGSIRATSPGKDLGTTVTVSLPLPSILPPAITGAEPQTEQLKPAAPAAACLEILLVEDHDATRETLALLLRRRGHRVTQASCMKTARLAAKSQPYDLLMSDIGLPDGRGDELLKELRAEGFTTPAIALSGYGMETDLLRSKAAGFSVHLTKPVSIQELDRGLAKIFGKPS